MKGNFLREFIGPLSEILGILSFFGINLYISFIKDYLRNNLVEALLIFSSGFLFKIFVEKIIKIKSVYRSFLVTENIEKITAKRGIKSIGSAIPSEKILWIYYDRLTTMAKKWAPDAKLVGFFLYLDYKDDHWLKPTIQAQFASKWKKETGTFYTGRFNNQIFEEVEKFIKINETKPFMEQISNWRELIIKAFDAVSTKLVNECSIVFHPDYERIEINFPLGKLKKRNIFYIKKNESGGYFLEV